MSEHEVQLPLFVLAALDPAGCTATFSKETMMGRSLGWNVTVFGSGLGGSSSIRVTSTWKFEASAGHSKLVFLPLTVTAATITVMAGTRVLSTTRQVVASEATPAKEPGLILLPPGGQTSPGVLIRQFPLVGDTSGAIATYEGKYKSTSTRRLDVGAGAFGAEAKLTAEVFTYQLMPRFQMQARHERLQLRRTGDHRYEDPSG